MSGLILPAVIGIVVLAALFKRTRILAVFIEGAREGLTTVISILPSLIALLAAVYMLRASGVIEAIASLAAPLMEKLGFPPETLVLMLLKPFSGSGALATGADIIRAAGPDSETGRIAAVMLSSAETTFYTVSVYFGAAGITRTRHTVPAALLADFTAFAVSAASVRFFT